MAATAPAPSNIVITLTSSGSISQEDTQAAQLEICDMIDKTLVSKLNSFKEKAGELSETAVAKTVKELTNRMKDVLLDSFNEKLNEFYDEVKEKPLSEITDTIISELGIQFDDALAGNKDGWNVDSYKGYKETTGNPQATESEGEEMELRRRLQAVRLSPLERSQMEGRLEELLAAEEEELRNTRRSLNAMGGRKTKQNKTRRKNQNKTRRKKRNKTKRKKQNKTKRKK